MAAASALDDLVISETGDSLMGAKIDTGTMTGRVQDYFDGFGTLHNGSVIGTVDGRITGATIDGTTTGIIVGAAGTSQTSGTTPEGERTATATGEIIGHLEGSFDGEGMAYGEIKQFNGYLKGDVFTTVSTEIEADNVSGSNIVTPTTNAWIDGTVDGTSQGKMTGNMVGYVDSTEAPTIGNGVGNVVNGDFKIDGHTVGFAEADSQKGIYGSIVGDAGISVYNAAADPTVDAVTITGPGRIQGAVGGDWDTGAPIGFIRVEEMIANNWGAATIQADDTATLDNVTVEGAVLGTLSGNATGELYEWDPVALSWNYSGQVYGMNVDNITGALVGTFVGDITGTAQGDITLDDSSTVIGVVAGIDDISVDHDSNNILDAYITIDPEGSLIGDFEGQIDIYGEIFADETTVAGITAIANANYIRRTTTTGFVDNTLVGGNGTIIGDAGVTLTGWDAPVTLTGGAGNITIVGAVGGDNIGTGAELVTAMIAAGDDPTATASYDNIATLTNVLITSGGGAADTQAIGTFNGTVGGAGMTVRPYNAGVWGAATLLPAATVLNGFVGAWVSAGAVEIFAGNITGAAQNTAGTIATAAGGNINGVVAGFNAGADADANGVADATITFAHGGAGTLTGVASGAFAGMAENNAGPTIDWVKADVDVAGWLEGELVGNMEGTVSGEAHGEINGLIKHATIEAQHFIGKGYTMENEDTEALGGVNEHLNIKFEGTAIGHIRGMDSNDALFAADLDSDGPTVISNLIEGLAANGAYINGSVIGWLDVTGDAGDGAAAVEQYVIGTATGTIDLAAQGEDNADDAAGNDIDTIEGQITGEVSSTDAELEGDYDGYFTGTGEVEGHFEGTLGAGNASTFEGEFQGTSTDGHLVGYAEGFVENAGPVSGMVDLDNVTFTGTFKGSVEMAAGDAMVGSFDGKMDGDYDGQIKAEKKDIAGLFSATNVAAGTYAATGGTAVVADGAKATVAGEEVTANENYKINQIITVYDQLGQTTDLLVTLENTGDSEWNITTSDGGQGTLTFEKPTQEGATGKITSIDYDGQYDLDLDSIIQVAGINEIIMSQ
ncbi:hypothetical protein KKH50_04795, partial [Patescibacteria group bacterium]|nr:hypothetical protein [Patescibacteria group bacterium]